jgi:hypothetical protein
MLPTPQQLDYAPAPFLANQRPFLRRALFALAIVLLFIVTLQYGPSGWRQARYIAGQRNCLRYTLAPDQITYTNDPAAAPALLAAGSAPVASVRAGSLTAALTAPSAGFIIKPLAQVSEDRIGSYARSGFGYIRQTVPNSPFRTGAFLHSRQYPGSEARLVAVVFLERQSPGGSERILEINALVWRPATWSLESRLELTGLTTLAIGDIDHRHIRIHGGQVDPADASHLTLPYEVDGQQGTIDGYLDNTDHVRLVPRDDAAATGGAAAPSFLSPREPPWVPAAP